MNAAQRRRRRRALERSGAVRMAPSWSRGSGTYRIWLNCHLCETSIVNRDVVDQGTVCPNCGARAVAADGDVLAGTWQSFTGLDLLAESVEDDNDHAA